ncbi:Protein of unknown function [Roseateles sp. YR242]|uniref:DUF1289 domain-containing protein n=1 Tax=Roseateles sp. YR242 TaxID=1855305 RepID=UPI0008AF08DD|nr:DUF1289 domain-containing protein [Roseateles sp. YR242]SEK36841.1 Protein of unknown function [Roseateles sp. YR242]
MSLPLADIPRTPEGRVASPCINICKMHDATGLCRGCARTITEIAGWSQAGDDERIRILALLPERRTLLRTHGVTEASQPAG